MRKANFTTYESKEERDQARALEASKTTYSERFYILMRLIKTSSMICNAKIIRSPHLP
jgi:hypothetical protein